MYFIWNDESERGHGRGEIHRTSPLPSVSVECINEVPNHTLVLSALIEARAGTVTGLIFSAFS
ncbi:MAG TPA: hypothetical protein VK506_12895, partial [Conexibacter sp.]|nr:hypothetical protein [Conexibacter sp.]